MSNTPPPRRHPVFLLFLQCTEKERHFRHLCLLQFINFLYSQGGAIIKIARCVQDTRLSRRWAHLFPELPRCLRALQETNTRGHEGARCWLTGCHFNHATPECASQYSLGKAFEMLEREEKSIGHWKDCFRLTYLGKCCLKSCRDLMNSV